jgi:hypothetical protein
MRKSIKRVSLIQTVNVLLELLNGDEEAASYMDEMQRDIARACEDNEAEFGISGYDTEYASFLAGQWSERIRRKKGLLVRRDGKATVSNLSNYLMALATDGSVFQVRRCAVCNRWMFARRKDQRACSATCRHKQYEQTPHAKERRNAYMRWRYAMYDSRDWLGVPKGKRPSFGQWLEYNEPTPREWERILKGQK